MAISRHKIQSTSNKTNVNNQPRATLAPHPDSKNLPTNVSMPPPPPLKGGGSRPAPPQRLDSFMRGFSNTSLLGDLSDMAPFEKKLFQAAMNTPDPVVAEIEPTSINV